MSTLLRRIIILGTAVLLVPAQNIFAQKKRPAATCTPAAFAALKALPKLEYDCPEGLNDFDDKILKLPERLAAIRGVMKQLEGFTAASWWQASVDELAACELHGSVGELTDDEKHSLEGGDYQDNLLGNHQIRLALLPDPCYQPNYNGANTFILNYRNGQVFVSQVLNGYFSRIENSIGVGFAQFNGQQIVEVSTGNSMPPSMLSYFFVIDPRTNKAVPRKMFRTHGKLSNEIYSAMLMGESGPDELKIIKGNRLAPSFSAYEELFPETGRKLRRIVYRWNGRFYQDR